MIFNPEKFQSIAVEKNAKMKDFYPLNINDLTINSENSVKLLYIEIDNKLSFEQHISTLCNKVLYTQTLIIVRLVGIFAHLSLYTKSKKYKNGHLDYYTTTSLVIILNS